MGITKKIKKFVDNCEEFNKNFNSHVHVIGYDNLIKLAFLFDRTDYRVYFPLAYRDNLGVFYGYAGSLSSNNVYDDLDDIVMPENFDFYVCPNGFKTGYNRKSDNLIGIQNIVIDIDAHDSKMSVEALQNHVKDFSKKLLKRLRPTPNMVNYTGRGIHLWYCIEPCHVALKNIVLSGVSMLCDQISTIMNDLDEQELSLDKAASMKLNGLFRLPGSYNSKTKTWSEFDLLHENVVSIDELNEKLHKKGWKSDYLPSEKELQRQKEQKKEQTAAQKRKSVIIHPGDYTSCLLHREKFMEHLFETRTVDIGQRDIMLFAMYSVVSVLYDFNQARQIIYDINNNFLSPLSKKELCNIIKEIETKHHRFTVQKFFDFVGASDAEKEWYYKSMAGNKGVNVPKRRYNPNYIAPYRQKAKDRTRLNKENRDKRILDLFNGGTSIAAIAREVGCSRPTVYNVVGHPFKL